MKSKDHSEGKLSRDMLRMMRRAEDPPSLLKNLIPCNAYTNADIDRYIREEMTDTEMSAFESHCADCMSCSHNLVHRDKKTGNYCRSQSQT